MDTESADLLDGGSPELVATPTLAGEDHVQSSLCRCISCCPIRIGDLGDGNSYSHTLMLDFSSTFYMELPLKVALIGAECDGLPLDRKEPLMPYKDGSASTKLAPINF